MTDIEKLKRFQEIVYDDFEEVFGEFHHWEISDRNIFLESIQTAKTLDELKEIINSTGLFDADELIKEYMPVTCKYCDIQTLNNTGEMCNSCWEVVMRIDTFLKSEKARKFVMDKLTKHGYRKIKRNYHE